MNVKNRITGKSATFLRLMIHTHPHNGSAIDVRVLIQTVGEETWTLRETEMPAELTAKIQDNFLNEFC